MIHKSEERDPPSQFANVPMTVTDFLAALSMTMSAVQWGFSALPAVMK